MPAECARLPSILVFQHYKENLRKCSLAHLRSHPALEFCRVKPDRDLEIVRSVRRGVVLAVGDHPTLDPADRLALDPGAGARLVVVDGTWTKVRSIITALAEIPSRVRRRPEPATSGLRLRALPAGLETAYPRRSKLTDDPDRGLASVEALVAALHLLGYPALDLLDGYHWKREFLHLNREFFDPPAGATSP